MVRLHISLLAVTLATGSALASCHEYQRRSELDANDNHFHHRFRYGLACAGRNRFQSHGLEEDEDLFGRDLDAFDDLEAREPFNFGGAVKLGGKAFKAGNRVAHHKNTRRVMKGAKRGARAANRAANVVNTAEGVYSAFKSRGLEDDEDLFGRDLDAFDDLEAREPVNLGGAYKAGKKVANHKNTRRVMKGVNGAANVVNAVQGVYSAIKSRGLEDDEDLFGRDLDAFDDLEAREPVNLGGAFKAGKKVFNAGNKVAHHRNTRRVMKGVNGAANVVNAAQGAYGAIKSRGLEDDEDLFGRDLDAEEFFGRENDLLDERDTIDDLD